MKPPAAPPPAHPGTYVLWFEMRQSQEIAIGRLGRRVAPAGHLVYVGSALGSGGLRARLRRHFSPAGAVHWHVDYLRAVCLPTAAWFAQGSERRECAWVRALAAAGATYPILAFGSSDCRSPGCRAHLLQLPSGWSAKTIEDVLLWTTRCLLPY